MTRHPADTLLRSLSAHTRKLVAEEARWHRQMQDPHGIADDLEELAQAPAAEMFEGLARMLVAPSVKTKAGGER